MKVTVAYDEGDDVSPVCEAIKEAGHEVDFRVVDSSFTHNIKGDVVFNSSRNFPGKYGNAFVPAALEGLGVPHTGPDALTSAICQDCISMRGILRNGGVRVPRHAFLENFYQVEVLKDQKFAFPVVYRSNESKRGVEVVYYSGENEFLGDLAEYGEEMFWPSVIDEYVYGKELVVFCYGKDKDFHSLKPIEIEYDGEIYDDEARVSPRFIIPSLLETEKKSIHNLAFRAHHLMGIDGWSRIDLKLGTDHLPVTLEIDPNPEFDLRANAALAANHLKSSDIINYILNATISKMKEKPRKEHQYSLFKI